MEGHVREIRTVKPDRVPDEVPQLDDEQPGPPCRFNGGELNAGALKQNNISRFVKIKIDFFQIQCHNKSLVVCL